MIIRVGKCGVVEATISSYAQEIGCVYSRCGEDLAVNQAVMHSGKYSSAPGIT